METPTIFLMVGFILIIFGAAAIAVTYYFSFVRPKKRREQITAHTTGRVLRMSNFYSNEVRIPLVEYEAEGKTYRICGPRFAGHSTLPPERGNMNIGANNSNIPPLGELPLIVRSAGRAYNAEKDMAIRYPVGKAVDVFYDPDEPKRAFVEREAPLPVWAAGIVIGGESIIILLGIIFIAIAVFSYEGMIK